MAFGKTNNTTTEAINFSPKWPARVISGTGATVGGTAVTADQVILETEVVVLAATTGSISYEY